MIVREIRMQTGLSQTEFARKFDIPKHTLQCWEQGIRKPPDYVVSMIWKILDYEGLVNNHGASVDN